MTELELRRALAELSGLRSDAEPIVTLYLDTHWTDEKKRDRTRVFVQEAVKQAVDRHMAHPQLEVMRRTLGRVARAAAEHQDQSEPGGQGQGLAVFACESLGLWRELETPRPFKPELCVDGRAHLLQLARLVDDLEPAIIAFVHGRGAQFYEVALGAIVNEVTVEGPLPRPPGEGKVGAAARGGRGSYYERVEKDERHAQEHLEHFRREAAEKLRLLCEREPRAAIVLVGTSQAVADFERMLAERMREKILARIPRPPAKSAWDGTGKHELLAQVVEKLIERERQSETDQVEHAIGEAKRGGLAVLGPEDVVLAVNERRVYRLILEEDFARSGWRCRNCGALGMNHDEVCSFCEGPLARVDALGEELAGRVLEEDGEVEIVAHTNRLHSYAGVAALLRQAKAKGLAGRESEAPQA
jgi:hypothetical protein